MDHESCHWRRPHLDATGSHMNRSFLMRLPVPKEQGMVTLVSKVAQGVDILVHLGFQGSGDQSTCSHPGQLIPHFVISSVCPSGSLAVSLNVAYLCRVLCRRSWVLPTQRIRCCFCHVNPQVLIIPSAPRSAPTRVWMARNH